MRKCHLNTCPVGVATQDPELRQEVRRQAGARRQLPVHGRRRRPADHGRASASARSTKWSAASIAWKPNAAIQHWKADGLDLTDLLTPAKKPHPECRHLLHAEAGSRPRAVARQHEAARPGEAGARRRHSRCAPNSTIINTESHRRHDPQPRDRQEVGRRPACPTTRSTSSSPARPAKASARSSRRASRSNSKATPTTTSARASPAAE